MEVLNSIVPGYIIEAIGWTIIHSLWQIGIISIILFTILHVLKKTTSGTKYFISVASMLLILFVTCITLVKCLKSQQFENEILPADAMIRISENNLLKDGSQGLMDKFIQARNSFSQSLEYLIPVLFKFWIVGLLFFLIKYGIGFTYSRQLIKTGNFSVPDRWIKKMQVLQQKLDLRKHILLFESVRAKVPLTIGFIKPVILIPIGILSGLPPEQIETILIHELAHIRRKDYLFNIIQCMIEMLFFYHPLVWWISSQINKERENCCDDIALQYCNESLTYAKALYNIQRISANGPRMAAAFSGQKKHLLDRITRVLHYRTYPSKAIDKILSSMLLLGFIVSFILGNSRTTGTSSNASFINPVILETENVQNNLSHDIFIPYNKISRDTSLANQSVVIKTKISGNPKTKNKIEIQLDSVGNISEIKVDGKEVAQQDYHKYHNLINETMATTYERKQKVKQKEEEMREKEEENKEKEMLKEEQKAKEKEPCSNRYNSGIDYSNIFKCMNDIIDETTCCIKTIELDGISIHLEHIGREIESAICDIDFDEIKEDINQGIEDVSESLEEIDWDEINHDIQDAICGSTHDYDDCADTTTSTGKANSSQSDPLPEAKNNNYSHSSSMEEIIENLEKDNN